MHMFENHLRRLDHYTQYQQWFEGKVKDNEKTLSFFYHNIVDCIRYLICQIAYRDDLVYVLRHEYDQNRLRIFSEIHTTDWCWEVQVNCALLCEVKG